MKDERYKIKGGERERNKEGMLTRQIGKLPVCILLYLLGNK